MKNKQDKAIGLSPEHKEALALLASRPEFKAFEKLLLIEQNNIVIQAFKIPSTEPQLRERKALLEGRVYELVKFRKTFEEAVKSKKDEK